jgi:hypothetical protein
VFDKVFLICLSIFESIPTSTPPLTFLLVVWCGLPIQAPLDDFSIRIAFEAISHKRFFDVVACFQESHHNLGVKN